MSRRGVHFSVQGGFWAYIIGQNPSVPKSNRLLHVVIVQLFFFLLLINSKHTPSIPLERWVIKFSQSRKPSTQLFLLQTPNHQVICNPTVGRLSPIHWLLTSFHTETGCAPETSKPRPWPAACPCCPCQRHQHIERPRNNVEVS